MKDTHSEKTLLAITGASGAVYAYQLLCILNKLNITDKEIGVVFSTNAEAIWHQEIGSDYNFRFKRFNNSDFNNVFASGSSDFNNMVILPCSMGVLGRIAGGYSNDLITRAADVILKESGNLILCVREAPYNAIHLQNMLTLSHAGAIIFPASPSFYSKPFSISDLTTEYAKRLCKYLPYNCERYKWGI